MAIALNNAAKLAIRPAEARGFVAAIKSFLSMFGAAVAASKAINSGHRPSNEVLARLGIDAALFPKKVARNG